MKRIFTILFLSIFISLTSFANPIKVGLILTMGGLGDKSFNDSAYDGLLRAKKDFGIDAKFVEPSNWSEDETFIKEFIDNKYDLIIATSYTAKEAMENLAKKYPNQKFAIVDTEAIGPNIASLVFNANEGSFLVGALAAQMSKTGKIGFIGGIDIPLINDFKQGYEAGAKYINPNIVLSSTYIGGDSPYSDPLKGKEQAISMIKNNIDVLYTAAGNTGNGVMEAIKENPKVYGIGVDSNQDAIVPKQILTSMIKNVDNSVYDIIAATVNNSFKGGKHTYGIKENGVGTTNFEFTSGIIGKKNLEKLEQIKQDIISGKIKVQIQ